MTKLAAGVASDLAAWYAAHRRELPWRQPRRAADPYCVWVAEVMLQQTRVETARRYYEAFLARFPSLRALARAREADVLTAWSGLGYYRRARNLWRAAREVESRWKGRPPGDPCQLASLPGVGRYTAAAIASIAFHQPVAAVDGNLFRVLSRLAGRTPAPAEARALATEILAAWPDPRRPGDGNQALMDLGAAVCPPAAPRCFECPLQPHCRAATTANPAALPARHARERRARAEAYWLRRRGDAVLLRPRPAAAGLMPGMWELPARRGGGRRLGEVRHAITIHAITAAVYAPIGAAPRNAAGKWCSAEEIAAMPLTGLTRKILRRFAPDIFPERG